MATKQPEPGRFPYTVDLYKPTEQPADAFGHIGSSFALQAQCAARVWTTSTTGSSRDAADLTINTPRLELLEPISGVDVGWQLVWRGKVWKIDATEERGFNLVVTLSLAG